MAPGTVLIGFLAPLTDTEGIERLRRQGVVAFAMESVPRITRAQSMDALSSQATVAGYKAVLIAADRVQKMFPLLMTAAGTVAPARVLVMGAGVAGLQAIATARRLGAVVSAFDVRPAVKEQVESLGAKFLDLGVHGEETEGGYAKELTPEQQAAQQAALEERVPEFDIVITTALVPGRPAPKLIAASTVGQMRSGSCIVDLAAEAGGNCELTSPGQEIVRDGVTIVGFTNLPSLMAADASRLYARNVTALLQHLAPDGELALDFDDDITGGPAWPARPKRWRHRDVLHPRADDPRARDLPRHRGDLEGADDAAHAADVGHECDPRDRHRGRDPDRRLGRRHVHEGRRRRRRRARLGQRRRWVRGHRPDAADVQEKGAPA